MQGLSVELDTATAGEMPADAWRIANAAFGIDRRSIFGGALVARSTENMKSFFKRMQGDSDVQEAFIERAPKFIRGELSQIAEKDVILVFLQVIRMYSDRAAISMAHERTGHNLRSNVMIASYVADEEVFVSLLAELIQDRRESPDLFPAVLVYLGNRESRSADIMQAVVDILRDEGATLPFKRSQIQEMKRTFQWSDEGTLKFLINSSER